MEFINRTLDEETLWRVNNEFALKLAPITTIFVIYAIIGITGNSISIYIYRFRMKNKLGQRYFISALSVTDLAACVVTSGFAISMDVLPFTFRSDIICKFMWTLNSFLTISSGLLLVVISAHRYRLICVPLGKPFNLFWRRVALIATYLTAAILSIPNLAFYGAEVVKHPGYNITGTNCRKSHDPQYSELLFIFNCILLLTFAVGAIALIVLYSLIGKTILAHLSNKSENRKLSTKRVEEFNDMADDIQMNKNTETDDAIQDIKQNTSQKPDKRDSKFLTSRFHRYKHTLMFMLITLIFLISYAPRVIIMILKNIYPTLFVDLSLGRYLTYLFFFRLYVVNNIVNPFLYGVFDLEFRNSFRQMLPAKCRKARPEK